MRNKAETTFDLPVRAVGANDAYAELLSEAARLSREYLGGIKERHAGVTQEALDELTNLSGPMPRIGEDPKQVLRLLSRYGAPATVASMGGRFFGGVVGSSLPASLAAHWIAAAWDQNACLFDFSPVAAYLEDVVLRWLCQVFGLPAEAGGAFVTGTQMAHVTALAAARNSLLGRLGWDLNASGLFGAPPVTIIVGEEVHATVPKALRLLGIGAKQIVYVTADGQGRMRPEHIYPVQGPTIICAQVGNVNTGACDPVDDICDVARDFGAWVHVDGAFGLWAAASPNRKHLVPGVAKADSWATDAHKWLNVPHDSGIAIVRNREDLQRAMTISAAYYPDPARKREPMQWGPESSRRARAVEIWAALKSLGSQGVAELIERTCAHAGAFANGLRAEGYEVLNDVVLNQVLVSFGNDEINAKVIEGVQADGTCWCGATTWKGRRAIRISVSSWATTETDVERSLKAVLRVAQQVRAGRATA
jgi:glutamate/tyrosine decarboxylase-like PLP-dependent enzyme